MAIEFFQLWAVTVFFSGVGGPCSTGTCRYESRMCACMCVCVYVSCECE